MRARRHVSWRSGHCIRQGHKAFSASRTRADLTLGVRLPMAYLNCPRFELSICRPRTGHRVRLYRSDALPRESLFEPGPARRRYVDLRLAPSGA